jgi:hypothetical protein
LSNNLNQNRKPKIRRSNWQLESFKPNPGQEKNAFGEDFAGRRLRAAVVGKRQAEK